MSSEPKDELIDLLREVGFDAHEFLPGETLPQFIERILAEKLL
jgi:hypothetical protein